MSNKKALESTLSLKDYEWTSKEMQPTEADFFLWKTNNVLPDSITDAKVRFAYEAYLKN